MIHGVEVKMVGVWKGYMQLDEHALHAQGSLDSLHTEAGADLVLKLLPTLARIIVEFGWD